MPTRSRTQARSSITLIVGLLISVVAIPLAASATPTPPSRTSGNAVFGIGAGNAKGLDGRPFLRFYASPGAVAQDHVVVRNIGAKPLRINVYTAQATAGENGSVGFTDRTDKPQGDVTWLTVLTPKNQGFVIVPRAGQVVLPVSLKLPMNASAGDHTLAVIASVVSKVKGASGQDLNFEQRVALRSYIRVSGDLKPSLEIRNISVQYSVASIFTGRGRAVIHYVIHNDGNLNLGGRSFVQVSGPLGSTGSTAVAPPDAPLLLPGASMSGEVVVNDVLAQMWMKAKVTVTPLKPLGDNDPDAPMMSATASFLAVPWTVLVILAALLLFVVVFLLWRRRRGKGALPTGPTPRSGTDAAGPFKPEVAASLVRPGRHAVIDDDIAEEHAPEEVAT